MRVAHGGVGQFVLDLHQVVFLGEPFLFDLALSFIFDEVCARCKDVEHSY